MKVVLPVAYPDITCYPSTSNVDCILKAHNESLQWRNNVFIQIYSIQNITLDIQDLSLSSCPYLLENRISRGLIIKGWSSFVRFLKDAIDAGYYLYLDVGISHIPAYCVQSKTENEIHDIFIYGYDDETQKVYIADFFVERYEFSTCSFSEMEQAFLDLSGKKDRFDIEYCDILDTVYAMKFRNNPNYGVDTNRIKTALLDYMEARASKDWFLKYEPGKDYQEKAKHSFGMACYHVLDKQIEGLLNGESPFGVKQAVHLIWNHKAYMVERLINLQRSGLLRNAEDNISAYKQLASQAYSARQLYLKYIVRQKSEDLAKLSNIYNRIAQQEYGLLNKLIADIN